MQIKTEIPQDKNVHAIPLEEGANILSQAYRSGEFWIFVSDEFSRLFVRDVLKNYYNDAQVGEIHGLILPPVMGHRFAVMALAKKWMNSKQLSRELRSIGVYLSAREVAERDVFIATANHKTSVAAVLANQLLSSAHSQRVNWYECQN